MGGGGSSKKKSAAKPTTPTTPTNTGGTGGLTNTGPVAFPASMNRASMTPVIPQTLQDQLAMAFSPTFMSQMMSPVQSMPQLVPHLGVSQSGASLKPPSNSPLFPSSGAATIKPEEKKKK